MGKPVDKSKILRDELDTIFSPFFFRTTSAAQHYIILYTIYDGKEYIFCPVLNILYTACSRFEINKTFLLNI